MDLVTLFASCALGSGAPLRPAPCAARPAHSVLVAVKAVDRWQPFITEASQRFGIPEAWIRSVMQAESAGLTSLDGRPITSRAGAMGLMQVMPETYAEMRRSHGLGADPYDSHDNILAGTAFLREMYDHYGYPGLFAAFNAGPQRYEDHLRRGTPLPAETLTYLAAIDPSIAGAGILETPSSHSAPAAADMARPSPSSGTALFFPVGTVSAVFATATQATSSSLFMPLGTPPGATPGSGKRP
jgi:hypothetical protein